MKQGNPRHSYTITETYGRRQMLIIQCLNNYELLFEIPRTQKALICFLEVKILS